MKPEILSSDLAHLKLEPSVLDSRIGFPASRSDRLDKLLRSDTSAYASFSVGDLIYDACRIDPVAVEGMDFARIDDLSDIFRFAQFSRHLESLPAGAFHGNFSQLEGYVGERVAASALRASGAIVEFPATSNQAGWDFLVNGQQFQVKCLANPSGVYHHLDRYPDIPVVVNGELGHFFAGDERVLTVDGFSYEDVIHRTDQSLKGGADLLDLHIPLITTAIMCARVARALFKKETDFVSGVGAVATDGAFAMTGGKLGSLAIGGALATVGVTGGWVLIIGPIVGGIAGFKTGRMLADFAKRMVLCRSETQSLIDAIKSFSSSACAVIDVMLENCNRFETAKASAFAQKTTFSTALHSDWIERLGDEIERLNFYRRRFVLASNEPNSIFRSSRDPRAIAAHLLVLAAEAGLLRVNLRSEAEAIASRSSIYEKALKKWLIR